MTTKELSARLSSELKNSPELRAKWEGEISTMVYSSAKKYRLDKGRKYLTLVDMIRIGDDAAKNFINNL